MEIEEIVGLGDPRHDSLCLNAVRQGGMKCHTGQEAFGLVRTILVQNPRQ